METKYSSEQLKKLIEDALECDINDKQSVRNNISEMIEQINVYHQELYYQNAELSQTISQLEIMKEKYHALFSDAPVGYVVFDRNDNIHEANNTFCHMMHLPSKEVFHYKITNFINPFDQDKFYFMKNHVLDEDKQEIVEIQMKSRDSVYDVSVICKPFHSRMQVGSVNETTNFICCAIMDITEMKKQQKRIIDMSYHDAMTGLYNRRFFTHISKEMSSNDVLPLSIATIDLDGLKIINDTLGHEYGDQAIMAVSAILRENAQSNFMLIRMGGDEIIALCPRTSKEEATRYLNLCEKMIYAENIEGIPISISYGVATRTSQKESVASISALSEDIMYSHKIVQSPRQKTYVVRQTITRLFEKHPKIQHHCERSSVLMYHFAKYLNLDKKSVLQAEKLGYIHDIGLIAIADPLIINDDDFDDEGRQEYQRHAQIGNRIIRSLFGYEDIATAVLYHHEQWDGRGYPYGLKEEDIPLLSRMMSLVDQFDRLYNYMCRPEGQRYSIEEVLTLLKPQRGTVFEPILYDKFVEFVTHDDDTIEQKSDFNINKVFE